MNARANTTSSLCIVPCLRYDDAPAAIRWLVHVFGFKEHLVVPGENNTIVHAQLTFGPGMIMVGSDKDDAFGKSPRKLGDITQSIYVITEAVDAHYARAKAAGAEIVRAIQDEDYGGRGYTARDCEGHVWTFGSYRP
jgi:uncharacterized glyoxalase superfamily protein PhnB